MARRRRHSHQLTARSANQHDSLGILTSHGNDRRSSSRPCCARNRNLLQGLATGSRPAHVDEQSRSRGAEHPDELVVYGGTGRAARSWEAFDAIVRTLRSLEDDVTMLVQSGKPVGVFRTNVWAPRVLLANSNLVGDWANWEQFRKLEAEGLMMYGQMTAVSLRGRTARADDGLVAGACRGHARAGPAQARRVRPAGRLPGLVHHLTRRPRQKPSLTQMRPQGGSHD
jgi:hypothetical protein